MQGAMGWRRAAVVLLAAVAVAPAAPASAAGTVPSAYAKRCQDQSRQPVAGSKRTPFATCVVAMARLAEAKSRSSRIACSGLPRKRAGSQSSPYSRCVKAGTALIRHGNGIDRAFVDDMVAHHVVAVEMAKLAQSKGQTPFIRGLASSIVTSQNSEIAALRKISAKLKAAGIKRVGLGLTRAETGIDHDASKLAGANPFDIAFVDLMIPHHQGAIAMSNVLLAKGAGEQTLDLAREIKSVQSQEVQIMQTFRTQGTGDGGHPVSDQPH